jgi:hypothetical protein
MSTLVVANSIEATRWEASLLYVIKKMQKYYFKETSYLYNTQLLYLPP